MVLGLSAAAGFGNDQARLDQAASQREHLWRSTGATGFGTRPLIDLTTHFVPERH